MLRENWYEEPINAKTLAKAVGELCCAWRKNDQDDVISDPHVRFNCMSYIVVQLTQYVYTTIG